MMECEMDRAINVLSGITGSGKSWLLKKMLERPEFQNTVHVQMDVIGKRVWGDRWITPTERVFRNELTRNEIKMKLIVEKAKIVFLEMPLLTRKYHQKPLVAVARDTERYLQAIEKELAQKENREAVQPHVRLNVVLVYCDIETVSRRINDRNRESDATGTNVFDLHGYFETSAHFQLPDMALYTALPLNTCDETLSGQDK